jgi:hypothetical protein
MYGRVWLFLGERSDVIAGLRHRLVSLPRRLVYGVDPCWDFLYVICNISIFCNVIFAEIFDLENNHIAIKETKFINQLSRVYGTHLAFIELMRNKGIKSGHNEIRHILSDSSIARFY